MIPGPVELGVLVAILGVLFVGPKLIPVLGKRMGKTVERLRHVDTDVREGRREASANE
jgi:Sec-independent protein translocase protein TatA